MVYRGFPWDIPRIPVEVPTYVIVVFHRTPWGFPGFPREIAQEYPRGGGRNRVVAVWRVVCRGHFGLGGFQCVKSVWDVALLRSMYVCMRFPFTTNNSLLLFLRHFLRLTHNARNKCQPLLSSAPKQGDKTAKRQNSLVTEYYIPGTRYLLYKQMVYE